MNAVSIKLDDGRTVTLMPFASTSVEVGDAVEEGQLLGTLAASGDRSSSATHLHMGLKDSAGYYDPMELFGATTSQGSSVLVTEASVAVSGVAASEATTSTTVSTTSMLESLSISTEGVSELEASSASAQFGTVTSGVVELPEEAEGVTVGASPLVAFMEACAAQASALKGALSSMAAALGVSAAALGAGLSCSLFALALGLAAFLWRKRGQFAQVGAG